MCKWNIFIDAPQPKESLGNPKTPTTTITWNKRDKKEREEYMVVCWLRPSDKRINLTHSIAQAMMAMLSRGAKTIKCTHIIFLTRNCFNGFPAYFCLRSMFRMHGAVFTHHICVENCRGMYYSLSRCVSVSSVPVNCHPPHKTIERAEKLCTWIGDDNRICPCSECNGSDERRGRGRNMPFCACGHVLPQFVHNCFSVIMAFGNDKLWREIFTVEKKTAQMCGQADICWGGHITIILFISCRTSINGIKCVVDVADFIELFTFYNIFVCFMKIL